MMNSEPFLFKKKKREEEEEKTLLPFFSPFRIHTHTHVELRKICLEDEEERSEGDVGRERLFSGVCGNQKKKKIPFYQKKIFFIFLSYA